MDIDHLQTYVETVRRGSFSEAARHLSLSQPGISRRIRRLESELGCDLIQRAGGVFTPTRQGLHVLRFAEKVLKEYTALLDVLATDEPVRGPLQIAASTTPGEYFLPQFLTGFLEQYPEVKATLSVMDSDTVAACVEEGHCDVGFIGRQLESGILERMRVAEDEIVIAVSSRHPFADAREISCDRLVGERFVERPVGSGTRESVEHLLAKAGKRLPPHRTAIEMNSVHSQLAAIASGQGIGFVSKMAVDGAVPDRIATVRIRGVTMKRYLYMVYNPKRMSRALQAFTNYVKTYIKEVYPDQ